MVTDGYKDTEIGVIPIEWGVKSLSMIGSFSKGKGISKNEVVEDGIPCMRYAEIYTEYDTVLKNIKSFIGEKSALNSKQIRQGDILFAGSGETLDDIGKSVAFIDDFEAYVGGDTVILSPTMDYNSLFMSFQLNSTFVRTQLRKLGQGSSVVHIYSSGLEKVVVPFPPLKEQEKIADILSTADDKIDAIASQIQKAETLKKGLLQKLLSEGIGHSEFKDSELGKIPESWEIDKLENLTTKIGDGLHGTPKYVEQSDYYFINGNNLNGRSIEITENTKCVSEEEYTKNKKILDDTTVLLSINGTIGSLAYYSNETVMLGKSVAYMNSNNRISKQFLFYLLRSSHILNYFMLELTGTTIKNLSLKTIRNSIVPLPPLKEQKQIANILSTADKKLEVLRDKKEKYETLKQGLMQKLLTGEVRVKV